MTDLELLEHIVANAGAILIREQDATGRWRAMSLSEMTADQALSHALRLVREKRQPILLRRGGHDA